MDHRNDPYWDTSAPVQNGGHHPSPAHEITPNHNRSPYGGYDRAANDREYLQHNQPHKTSEYHLSHRNRHSNPDFPKYQQRNNIDDLQSRIRNMLSDNSRDQQATCPPEPPSPHGRSRRGLYHSPPLRGGQPPNHHDGIRNATRDADWDSCEDITAYALGIVKSLEIPEDERREKEEFCHDLEKIVQGIRPSIPTVNRQALTNSCKSRIIRKFCEYFYNCKFRYRLLCHRSEGNIR